MSNLVSEAVMKAVYLLLLFSAFVMLIKKKMRSNRPLWRKEEGCSSPVEEKKAETSRCVREEGQNKDMGASSSCRDL